MDITIEDKRPNGPIVKVIGVGGGGSNAVERMIASGMTGVEFITLNTDAWALRDSSANMRIQIGENITGGHGTGGKPELGREAAENDIESIREVIKDSDILFIAAGLGRGTGTGAAPLIAREAAALGALTIGVVTKPFNFEGRKLQARADAAIDALEEFTDTLLLIPNQKLFSIIGRDAPSEQAISKADDVLSQAVRCISDIISRRNQKMLINVDFADLREVIKNSGGAIMGIGSASGRNRAVNAAEKAINSPLLDDVSISGSSGIIVNIRGSSSITLGEVDEAVSRVRESAAPYADIFFGLAYDPEVDEEEIKITVIATGCSRKNRQLLLRGMRDSSAPRRITPEKFPAYMRDNLKRKNK